MSERQSKFWNYVREDLGRQADQAWMEGREADSVAIRSLRAALTRAEVDAGDPRSIPARVRDWLTFRRGRASALQVLFNEIDCRIEHGAESGGHLEYVREQLRPLASGD